MIIVAGTIRVPENKIEALRPTAEATLLATRNTTRRPPSDLGA